MTDEKQQPEKNIKALNKFNLALIELLDARDQHDNIHVTSDFTEITNGHFVLRITTPAIDANDLPADIPVNEEPINAVISTASAKEVRNSIPKVITIPILKHAFFNSPADTKEERIKFTTTNLDVKRDTEVRREDYRYPNTDAVMPKEKPEMEIGFNPEYMMKLCKQFKDNGIKIIKLSLYGDNKAMKIEGVNPETGQELTALLMPCKLS